MNSAVDNIEKCEICGLITSWDGGDGDATLWSCEVGCGMTFCEQCFIDEHGAKVAHEMFGMDGSIDDIQCPTCYAQNQAACVST